MIPVDSLLYGLDLRLNKVATNKGQSIPDEDKIIALNDGMIKLIKYKVGPDRVYGLGLDGFKKKYEDLQNLIQTELPVNLQEDKVSKLNKFKLNIRNLTPKYLYYIDSYFLCNKGKCKDRVVVGNRIRHADLSRFLNNSNTNPSFEYQESIVTTSDDYLEFYTDGSFEPTKGYISYLRYPKPIDVEGYIHLDGTISTNSDCELKEHLEDELLDFATQSLAIYTGNQSLVQGLQIDKTE